MNATTEPNPNRTQRAPFRVPVEDEGLQRNEEQLREQIRKSDEFLRKQENARFMRSFFPGMPC